MSHVAADAGGDGGRLRGRGRRRRRGDRLDPPLPRHERHLRLRRGGRARRVRCRCSRWTPGRSGFATGYAVLAAAAVARDGGTPEEVAAAALARAEATTSLFYVDTLEYLRRGGRVGAAAALLGGALAVKPLLTITDGKVASLEKVRTAARGAGPARGPRGRGRGRRARRDHRRPPGQPRARRAAGREAHRAAGAGLAGADRRARRGARRARRAGHGLGLRGAGARLIHAAVHRPAAGPVGAAPGAA